MSFNENMPSHNRIVREPETVEATGLAKSTIRRLEKRSRFPKRIKLGPRAVGWRLSDIQDWQKDPEGYKQVNIERLEK
ncbi:MAG: AlpA family transcriptional regulator [Pseudomonadales bacterium]|nr:AlpA family transcriptional regulator [Pseudomonadales bacterium]